MRLSIDQCWNALRSADHGVLCTTSERGTIDAVPICFAVVSNAVVTAVDRVKPKSTTDLGRLKNLANDPAATLLCEQWNREDWSKLWWVRANLVCRSAHEIDRMELEEAGQALREDTPSTAAPSSPRSWCLTCGSLSAGQPSMLRPERRSRSYRRIPLRWCRCDTPRPARRARCSRAPAPSLRRRPRAPAAHVVRP